MNREEFEKYTALCRDTMIHAADFTGPNRSLLTGYNFVDDSFCVALEEDRIVLSIGGDYEARESWNAEDLNPGKRAFPEETDYDFAVMMRNKGAFLSFTVFHKEDS